MLTSPHHQTLGTQQGLGAVRDTLQCCSVVPTPPKNTLLIHPHRCIGTAKEEKLSGARRCLHVGRETNPEHTAR